MPPGSHPLVLTTPPFGSRSGFLRAQYFPAPSERNKGLDRWGGRWTPMPSKGPDTHVMDKPLRDRYKETQTRYTGMLPSPALQGSHATRASNLLEQVGDAELLGNGCPRQTHRALGPLLSARAATTSTRSPARRPRSRRRSTRSDAPPTSAQRVVPGQPTGQWEQGSARLSSFPGATLPAGVQATALPAGRNEPIGRTCELPDHCEVT